MAIDIRATVTCSLGTLISGSISDDYLQGSGLVKTKGSCEISALITPAVGTVVTFDYVKGGVTRAIPRKLRVLSSFADPFRRTTKVELGCKLTYLSDLKEAINWDAFDDPENTGYTQDDDKIITIPIHASSVMAECLSQLGITASSSPLTNKFSIAKFDFGPGYVQVLSDLLVSESYFGYLDFNEVLQVRDLAVQGGAGPVFTSADIVDLGPIGVGQLPGEAVTISYSTLKLKEPDGADEDLLNWEREEVIGSKTFITVQYVNPNFPDTKSYQTWEYIPRTVIETLYDDWDRVVSRVSTSYTIGAAINTQYYVDTWTTLATFIGFYEISEQEIVDTETIEYVIPVKGERPETGYEDVKSNTRIKSEPQMAIAGAIAASFVEEDGTIVDYMPLYGNTITEKSITTYETSSAFISGRGNTPITKTIVTKFKAYGYTQSGQQETARQLEAGTTVETAIFNAMELVPDGVDVTINSGRGVGLQERPPSADRTNAEYADGGDPNNGWRTESDSELELALGSATAQRRIEFSLPYAPDDIFSGPSGGPFTVTPSDAAAKANRYGRVQNRLLLGNRSGVNLQVAPEKLPVAPFSPLYLQADGLTALYRANGNQWAFDSNGIVCSTDALFWAAVSGTGSYWFPVAPGVTTLPAEPAIVDGEMNATTIVLPYNETARYDARLRLGMVVSKFEYALEVLTEVPAFTVTVGAGVDRYQLVSVPVTNIALAAAAPVVTSSNALRIPAAVDIAVAAPVPTVGSGIGSFVSVPAAAITIAAVAPTTTTNGVDGDAAAYIAAVESADGQSLEEGVKSAINSFVLGCKADGIWAAIKASCILAGARTLTGALVPLVGTAPTNVGGLFVSGDYDRETGLVGDGSTKYLDSNRNNNADPQNNRHASVYVSVAPTATGFATYMSRGDGATAGATIIQIGDSAISGSSTNHLITKCSGSSTILAGNNSQSVTLSLKGVSRNASASHTLRSGGSNFTVSDTSASPLSGNVVIYAAATPAISAYTNARLAFYSIGESLDLALLDTRVTALVDAIAAAIP
jgi:hypothetical protein